MTGPARTPDPAPAPDLSVIVVNWNTRDLLAACLASVRDTVLPPLRHEVIVVDNGSADGSADMVRDRWPDVVLLANPDNRGFAAANNQALRIMRGRYALLLNTDARLLPEAAARLCAFADDHPRAAMACGQLLHGNGRRQNSTAPFPTLTTLVTPAPLLEWLFPRRFPGKRGRFEGFVEVDSAVGACLLVRRQAIEAVGLLDERFFFFFEETDWALQMKRQGWQVWFVPSAQIVHLQGQTIGHALPSRIAFYRARYRFFRKWNPYPRYLLFAGAVFARLLCNGLFTTLAWGVSCGRSRTLRDRKSLYAGLLRWHLRRDVLREVVAPRGG